MSKARATADTLLSLDAAAWRRRIQQLTEAHAEYWPQEITEAAEWNADGIADALLSRPAEYGLSGMKVTKAGCTMTARDFCEIILHGYRAGFLDAVRMHRRELLAAGDLAEIKRGRIRGGEKGRKTLTTKKDARAAKIRAMAAEGAEPKEIARTTGCSISTVYRAIQTVSSKASNGMRRSRKR